MVRIGLCTKSDVGLLLCKNRHRPKAARQEADQGKGVPAVSFDLRSQSAGSTSNFLFFVVVFFFNA